MSFDVRTRVDGEEERLEPGAAREAIAAALASAGHSLQPALHLAKRPLTVDVDGTGPWHLANDGDTVRVIDGAATDGSRLRLTAEQLADLWCDQATPMAWFSSGAIDLHGRLEHLLDWWVLLRRGRRRVPRRCRVRPHPRRLQRGRDGRREQRHGRGGGPLHDG